MHSMEKPAYTQGPHHNPSRGTTAIKQVKNNYEGRMKRSLEAHLTLQGGTMDLGNNASRESRHQELKYNEDIDVFNEGENVKTVSFADKVTRASFD